MQEMNFMDKYPIYKKEILKSDTNIKNVDKFIDCLKEKIENDKVARYIWVFDHYSHTKNLNWNIIDWMIDWKILLFCFGQAILNPFVMSARPRNIAIAEFEDKFIVSFLKAPKEELNKKMISWIIDCIK